MKIKVLVSLLVFIGLQFADSVDFSKWMINIEIKELPKNTNQVDTIAKSIIKNLVYDASRSVQAYLKDNSKLARQFDRLYLKIKESNIRFLSDGSTIYEYEVPITGAVLQLLSPPNENPVILTEQACPVCKRIWLENQPIPEDIRLIPMENDLTPQYTAILIDARDINLVPSLFPKIYNEDTKEVYSINFIKLEQLNSKALITYVKSIADDFNNDLVGINPLRITAIKSTGANKTDMVIPNTAAKMMHSSVSNLKLLEQCKVVVIISE